MKTILGIDPGLETLGYAIIQQDKTILDFGVIITSSKNTLSERLLEIQEEFEKLINLHKIDLMVIEKLMFVQNVTSGIQVAHARGVVLAEAEKKGLLIAELQAKEIKSMVTGYGNAPKDQVKAMVKKIFNLEHTKVKDDATDALAIAYCGL
ncbi:MAG: crossover junction endodeoxyribonuclease RuvC [Candidatus Gracilibacteria bacterium]|jgi:crossover junction endodeoxyribonuclease RuvC|nr:crossover junction endodeoxyribonuclease RuvC [Candidatus Gracilibacteria bacterium]